MITEEPRLMGQNFENKHARGLFPIKEKENTGIDETCRKMVDM